MNWMTEVAPNPESVRARSGSDWGNMNPSEYLEQTVIVNVEHGMHMIPCSRIALLARDSDCEVRVVLDEQVADAKNVLDLLMLKAEKGTTLLLQTRGDGAEDVLTRIVELFKRNFELPSQ